MNQPTPGLVQWKGIRRQTKNHLTEDCRHTLCGRTIPMKIARWGGRPHARGCKRCWKIRVRQAEEAGAFKTETEIKGRTP